MGFFDNIVNGFRSNLNYNPMADATNLDFNDPKTWARIGALSGVNPNSIGGPAAALAVGAAKGAGQAQAYKQGQQQIASGNLGLEQKRAQINFFRQLAGKQPLTSEQVSSGNFGDDATAGTASASQPAPSAPAKSPFDTFYDGFLAPHEGGFTPSDGNGKPANFGINQGANPDVNVKDLTPDAAKKLAYDRYWKTSGADQMNPTLGAIQADTAFNMGPSTAFQMLQASGGDPQKYLALRDAKYKAIAAADPSKATLLPTWLKRNADLAQFVSQQGQQAPQGNPAQGLGSGVNPLVAALGQGDPDQAFQMLTKQKQFLTPDEVTAYGFRPGTVVTRGIDGSFNVEQQPPARFLPATPDEAKAEPYIAGHDESGKPIYKPQGTYTLLSPQAVKDGAATWIVTGKLPGSMRDKATVSAMLNAAEDFKPPGMDSKDWAWMIQNNRLALHGKEVATGQAARSQVATAVNEGTVNNSINILRKLLPVAASHGPFTDLNELEQWVGRKTNNADAANFKNAIDSISNEYARIMTGSTTGAPTSDSARKEASSRIILGYNDGTIEKVLQQMQAEMQGRSNSYNQVLKELTGGGFGGADVPGAAPQSQSSGGHTVGKFNPATGKIEYH